MLRIFKWTLIVSAWLAGTGFLTMAASAAYQVRAGKVAQQRLEQERRQAADAFARLGPAERHLAIYDAFCRSISDNYFDPEFSGVDWAAVQKNWRPRAAGARDDSHLYDDVLTPIAAMFHVSHLTLQYPDSAMSGAQRGPHIEATGIVPGMLQRGHQRLVVVDDLLLGSPAERAGVTPGWLIESWKAAAAPNTLAVTFRRLETPAQILEAQESMSLHFSSGGTEQELRARFDEARLTLDLPTRERGPKPAYSVRKYGAGVLYVNLVSFADPPSLDRLFDALDEPPAALILDLRQNSGGNVSEIHRFAERMLPPHALFGFVKNKSGLSEERTSSNARGFDRPVVALIGPRTYSGGEIAAAIVHSRTAVLIGGMTAGAVLVSRTAYFLDGGGVSVPEHEFQLPDGSQIEGKGVRPDIPLFATLDDVRSGRDAALERALAQLRTGS